jgi:hypothetical protein
VPIADADTFFKGLRERIETLAQSQKTNPSNIELLVNTTKRYLTNRDNRIRLDELFEQETERLIQHVDSTEFAPDRPWDQNVFRKRIRNYEFLSEPLARMAGVLGRWGDDSEMALVLDIVRSLHGNAEKRTAGLNFYVSIRFYPAVLIFTAYALGLTRARRWMSLHRLFAASVDRNYKEPKRLVETLFLWSWIDDNVWKRVEGRETLRTPVSDHLCDLFTVWGSSFAALTPDFERMFELYEVLGSLTFLENTSKTDIQKTLKNPQDLTFVPVGRAGWHTENLDKILADIQKDPMKSELIKAGFAQGDGDYLDAIVANFHRVARRMRFR